MILQTVLKVPSVLQFTSHSGRLTFLKEKAHYHNGLCYKWPTQIKQCPIGCSLRKIPSCPKLVDSSTCSFQLKFVWKKIKPLVTSATTEFTTSNGDLSIESFFWCIDVSILVMASACSFWPKFWLRNRYSHFNTLRNPWIADTQLLRITDSFCGPNCMQTILNHPF